MKCSLRVDSTGRTYVSNSDLKINLTKLNQVYRVWQSTQDLLCYANWLPEVVGTVEELRRIGSVPMLVLKDEQQHDDVDIPEAFLQPELFKDADVSGYRRLLARFRLKHRSRT